ncbi:MAG: hypothetical protein DRP42_00845 [Tenericutes bacterium]|nr:MAG: hypothetical protein DRP42_00845 [Mycoplasmatota bacterium]
MINIEKYRPANDKSFFLEYNQKKVRILIKRIKTVKDHYENLIKRDEMALDEGYFKYRVDGINSLLFSKPIDVIFVD